MRIGDFARLGNVSVRALRFYDARGLLRAMHVDPETGYRHYGPDQIVRLQQIRAFQDWGFSLAKIRELRRRDLPAGSLRDLMEQRRSELKRRIGEDVARLARMEQRLQDLTGRKGGPSAIMVRETRDSWVVSLREKRSGRIILGTGTQSASALDYRGTRGLLAHVRAKWRSD